LPELWDPERRGGDDLQEVRVQPEGRCCPQVQGHHADDERPWRSSRRTRRSWRAAPWSTRWTARRSAHRWNASRWARWTWRSTKAAA